MKFLVLKRPTSDSPEDQLAGIYVTDTEDTRNGDFPKCPHCGYPSGMREWLPPYQVEVETWGRRFGDIAQNGDVLVVSDRFVNAFQNAGLRGLSGFKPVEVVKVIHRGRKPAESIPSYFKATIHRSATTVDQDASGYVWGDRSQVCPVCLRGGNLKRYLRVVIDETTWDGDDIFWPRGGPCIIVTEQFKNMCEQNEILGVIFTDPQNESYDLRPWEADNGNTT